MAGRLGPGTLKTYGRIARRIEASGLNATAWLEQELAKSAARAQKAKGKATAASTLLVLRAAASAYIDVVEKGNGKEATSPFRNVHGLRQEEERQGLPDDVLAMFVEHAKREMEPYATILQLLPLTGLRIHEICELPVDHVDRARGILRVLGKRNKPREVALSARAQVLLYGYLNEHPDHDDRVFLLHHYEDGMDREEPKLCHPRDVWRAMTRMRKACPALGHVVIHQTRHTTATRLLQRGVSLKHIQDILGHEGLDTLQRYLKTTVEEQRSALDRL